MSNRDLKTAGLPGRINPEGAAMRSSTLRLRAINFVLLAIFGEAALAADTSTTNLVLITIDTLRADYLSCNGSSKVKTPRLDRLAREGVNFTRARSPVPLTLPAHASIFTGNYPPTHGVRDNSGYRLPDRELSLAEVLRDYGYHTAAFVGSFALDRRYGLAQGFDFYDNHVWSDVAELETLEAERPAEEVLAAFLEWLGRLEGERPFFAWVHFYDPHAPYEPPEPYRSLYPRDLYAGEVAYTDAVLGKMVDELSKRGDLSATLLAVVGDHGEGLGEHGEMTHSLLIYNSTLHVPMLLRGPGLEPAGRVVPDLVRIIDLAPTLLDYLDLSPAHGEGVSLRSLIERDQPDVPLGEGMVAYSESLYPQVKLGWSALRGLETRDYRIIMAPRPELYDLRADPGETANLLAVEPGVYREIKRQLVELLQGFAEPGDAAAPSLDSDELDMLRRLGYLSGSDTAGERADSSIDPKDHLDLWHRLQLSVVQFAAGKYRAAADTLIAVLAQDPGMLIAYDYLGTCYQKLSQPARAEATYREAINRGLESARIHHELGRILLMRMDPVAAESELRIALELDPRRVAAHYDLAQALRATGDLTAAVEEYRVALEINPDYLWAWSSLGITLASMKKQHEALVAFRRVVVIDPSVALGYFNLAVQLERMGVRGEALASYRRFLELSEGQDLDAQRQLAEAAIAQLSH